MADPTVEAQIEAYLERWRTVLTPAELQTLRATMLDMVVRAQQGDAQALEDLRAADVYVAQGEAAAPSLWERFKEAVSGLPVLPAGGTTVGDVARGFAGGGAPERAPGPSGVSGGEPGGIPPGTTPGPLPGSYWQTEPTTGKMFLIGPTGEHYDMATEQWVPDFGILDEQMPTGADALKPPGYASSKLKDLQAAIAEEKRAQRPGWQDRVQTYQQQLNTMLSAYGAPAAAPSITAYQAGQLEISRARLAIDREEAQRKGLETRIGAARTGQPLTYLSLLRGKVAGAGGTDLYQGVKPVVPTLAGAPAGAGAAGGAGGPQQAEGGWVAPKMPPAMATIAAGRPLGPAIMPAGTLRPPGVQAQAEQTPFEARAYAEATEFQGIPSMDWQDLLRRGRTAIGAGLSPYTYGGINVRR